MYYIKKIPLFILLFINILCFSQTDEKWEAITDTLLITTQNASNITHYKNTPESITTYFYASKIRQDQAWKEVLPPEENWTKRLQYKVAKYKNWTIKQFRLLKKTEFEKDKFWIKIFMKIEYNGKTETGTDEVTLEKINNKWVITSIPT